VSLSNDFVFCLKAIPAVKVKGFPVFFVYLNNVPKINFMSKFLLFQSEIFDGNP
jgi:hypothetical protein